jgi:hypothetical protein
MSACRSTGGVPEVFDQFAVAAACHPWTNELHEFGGFTAAYKQDVERLPVRVPPVAISAMRLHTQHAGDAFNHVPIRHLD